MFDPKLIFEPDIDLEERACIGIVAPSCNSWWDSNSQCQCKSGCITPSWTSTSSN